MVVSFIKQMIIRFFAYRHDVVVWLLVLSDKRSSEFHIKNMRLSAFFLLGKQDVYREVENFLTGCHQENVDM